MLKNKIRTKTAVMKRVVKKLKRGKKVKRLLRKKKILEVMKRTVTSQKS
jgi:hypothetical protein